MIMDKLFPLYNYTETHSKRSKKYKYSIRKEGAKYPEIKKKIESIPKYSFLSFYLLLFLTDCRIN
jgi:hypothetical protein